MLAAPRRCIAFAFAFLLAGLALGGDEREMCRSSSAQKSCGQCIKTHPECGWCSDPRMSKGGLRCDLASELGSVCSADAILHPKSETTYLRDIQIGQKKPDGVTTVQIQPQQVKISMKAGESVSFPLTYLHGERDPPRNVYALNSETASNGIKVDYSNNCKGRVIAGPQCAGVAAGETVVFNVSLTLAECKTQGDAVVSIGIGGLRDVVAVYVTPLCGCQCEKLGEQIDKAAECGGFGRLVCGACVCDKGRGGPDCGCDLRQSGAGSQDELEDRCRASSEEEPCSGKGQCLCGQCTCDADFISGQFCECDDTDCPMADGMTCGGHGDCVCGTCNCESGWQGNKCDCSADSAPCTGSDGLVCGGHGMCVCGKCECDKGWEGDLCAAEDEDASAEPESEPESHYPEEEEEFEEQILGTEEAEPESLDGEGDGDGDDDGSGSGVSPLPGLSLLSLLFLSSLHWLRH